MAASGIRNFWLSTPSPHLAEVVSRAGFDAVTVDMQHGLHDVASVEACFRAIALGTAKSWVRVPWNEPGVIMKVLDLGAEGIICPMISTAAEARAFAGACLYPFDGGYRSYGPIRAAALHEDYVARSRKVVTRLAMIETREGFDNMADIAAVDGIDGFYIGPSDLSLAFGMAPAQDQEGAEFLALVDRIRDTAHAAGRICAIHGVTGAYGRKMLDRGFDMVTLTADTILIAAGARAELAACGSGPDAG